VLVNGRVVVEGGKFVGEPGSGRYLSRTPLTAGQKQAVLAGV